MPIRAPSRSERLAKVRDSLTKVYEANDLPANIRALLAELDRNPPKQPVKPN
jgi:hypothetical protein